MLLSAPDIEAIAQAVAAAITPQEWFGPEDAAAYIDLSATYLAKLRGLNAGPPTISWGAAASTANPTSTPGSPDTGSRPMLDDENGNGPGGSSAKAIQGDSASVLRQTKVIPDRSLLEPLNGLGLEFLQLHKPFDTRILKSGKVVKVGKAPMAKRWTQESAGSDQDARVWMADGYNVGGPVA